jgi:hypothetical protein
MVLVMPQEVSLLIPVVEGRELTATVTWVDLSRELHVSWPTGAKQPALAFDKPIARTGPVPSAEFRSPIEHAICDCWQQLFGGVRRGNNVRSCPGAYGAPDAACVDKYYHPPASCPELLACIRRDPASPP